ncbi:MAG TPA: hypothetical protein VFU68_01830 [Terracidiphilus sp.]|nr:hypothetical protein [Terracidiphilus sp.]
MGGAEDSQDAMNDDAMSGEQRETLSRVFAEQLLACLQECARGRKGLFSDRELTEGTDEDDAWPEAARLRELAVALQAISHQAGEPNALCDEFLELCTIHGEANPGEPRLAREFLARIERGEVGGPTQERLPW